MSFRKTSNRICQLFEIDYPIIQAGMVWASGWRLASAVSNAGGLGLIGGGSLYPDNFRHHIQQCRKATTRPFGVNLPLLLPSIDKHVDIAIEEKVSVVFTSAGNPSTWTQKLKSHGIKVVHVVSSSKFAKKAEDVGCDAVVAEGFEAGGHNGREETTTLCLVPAVREAVNIPVLAAGGIATGRAMYAMMALGADGVQIGTRFVASEEASSHSSFKNAVINSKEGDTKLMMKSLYPVRLLANKFAADVAAAEEKGASRQELATLLGRGRSKQGMFLGDLQEGELEIGQISAIVREILPAQQIVRNIWHEFEEAIANPFQT